MYLIRFFLTSFVLWGLCSAVVAQTRPSSGGGNLGGGNSKQTEYIVDTSNVLYFFATNPDIEYSFSDSLLGNYFQQYDPARAQDLDYVHLGNMGAPARPMVFQPAAREGFDLGLHQFDLYYTTAKDLQFYNVESAFSNLFYSVGSDQNDGIFKAQFTRNFGRGLNFSLEHNRVRHQIEDLKGIRTNGNYTAQTGEHTTIATGMWYQSKNKRYDAFISFSSNVTEHKDTGGITTDELLKIDGGGAPYSIPVYLDEAETRHEHKELDYRHYYKFKAKKDSLNQEGRKFLLSHHFNFRRSKYKFSDTNPNEVYYSPLVVDERGLRHFVGLRKYENTFTLATSKAQKNNTEDIKRQGDLLEVGLTHRLFSINQEPTDTTINNLFLKARWDFTPNENLKVRTYAHYGLWDNGGDYKLSGSFFFQFPKLGSLELTAINQQYAPSLLEHRMYVSKQLFYENNFKKTNSSTLSGTYRLDKFDLQLQGKYHLLNNFIYRDESGFAQQEGKPVSVFQLILKKDFKLWRFHLDNVVALQESTEDVLRLPAFFSKHSFYYQDKIFKNVLLTRAGVDLRMNGDYFANDYLALVGQFHLQNESLVELYPALDIYLSMQVSTFRAFFKYENIGTLFLDDDFYQTPNYPMFDTEFRFGISWQLRN